MDRFYLTPEARDDLDHIWLYIAQDNLSAANNFEDELLKSILNLAEFPNLGYKREELTTEPVRFYLFKNFVMSLRTGLHPNQNNKNFKHLS